MLLKLVLPAFLLASARACICQCRCVLLGHRATGTTPLLAKPTRDCKCTGVTHCLREEHNGCPARLNWSCMALLVDRGI